MIINEPKIFFRFFLEISFSDRKFFKSKYLKKFFWKLLLFMFHATLIIMSRKYFFEIRNYPSIYDFGLEVSPCKCNLRRQNSPLQLELGSGSFAFRGTYREWLGPKILSPKFFKYFLETTFLYVLWYSDHYEPKIFFRFFLEISFSDRKFFKSKYFKKFFWKLLLFMFHATLIIMSRKYFFDFRNSQLPFDIRFWTRGFPLQMQSQKAGLPFATRARKRELSIQEVRIEKVNIFRSFSENHFSNISLVNWDNLYKMPTNDNVNGNMSTTIQSTEWFCH